jgi:hypothetical protein
LGGITDLITDAYYEIRSLFLVFESYNILTNVKVLIDLYNSFNSGQITINEIFTQVVIQWVIVPVLASIVLGIIINQIKKIFYKNRGGIIGLIIDAYNEIRLIFLVFVSINALTNVQLLIDLYNSFNSGQITINEIFTQVIQWVIVPVLASIVLGIIINQIIKKIFYKNR